ncbi:hypothetical protein DRP07_10615 [Archaeoglobales archaeon]|nr:MAG: hypothetical protein DRP07_10615 [Archaeoglobales archaeon]
MSTSKLAERLFKAGIHTMSKEEAISMIEDFANKFSIDLRKADLDKTREILKKGKPLSRIVIDMRER